MIILLRVIRRISKYSGIESTQNAIEAHHHYSMEPGFQEIIV